MLAQVQEIRDCRHNISFRLQHSDGVLRFDPEKMDRK
jgi:hypothetical protein